MFEELRLLGSTERSIVVQTRKGTAIRNVIEAEPGPQERQKYRVLLKKYGAKWIERKPATGQYNCAGHVWASRRTSILDPASWRVIQDEDGYRRLRDDEPPASGDLALYVDEANSEMLHVGVILELRPGIAQSSNRIPWVLSKWNSTSGEVMHYVDDAPYASLGFSVRIEYWTDRPLEEDELR